MAINRLKWMCFTVCAALLSFLQMLMPVWGEEQSQEQITHKIFHITNRRASEMEALVKMFLSGEGQIVSDDRSNVLVVKDYPSVISRIEQFLPNVDKPLPQVRIYVGFNDSVSSSWSGWGLSGVVTNKFWVAGIWGGAAERSGSSSGTMNLITMSGTWGEFTCGEQIFSPQWFFDYALNCGYISSIPVYRSVSTGFGVMPVVRGDTIELTVAPQISYFTDLGRNTIRFLKAATTMTVGDGQTVAMGAGTGEESIVVRQILGSANARQSQSSVLILTPVIDRR
ncbi:MAG: secretin N-terminal domain-containing protein [Vulcanimicrobiota bacterium]